jgi:hypothetical protein
MTTELSVVKRQERLHNEDFRNLDSSINIIRIFERKKMIFAENVRIGKMKKAYEVSVGQKTTLCVSTGTCERNSVFWDVVLWSLVEVCRRFRGACCLHQQTTILNIPEHSHVHVSRCKDVKSDSDNNYSVSTNAWESPD